MVKKNSYKIALFSVVLVLMLVSTVGAFPFCGCGYGCGDQYRDHSCNDKSSDESSNKCIVCPACPTCPPCNCPTCPVPALYLNKTANLQTCTQNNDQTWPTITYTYTVKNTGNVGLNNILVYDNKTNPAIIPVVPTLAQGASSSVTATYIPTQLDAQCSSVTNEALATAVGSGINVVSNVNSTMVTLNPLVPV